MRNSDRMSRNGKLVGLTFLVCALIWLPVGLSINQIPRGYVFGSSAGLMVGAGLGYLIFKAMTRSKSE